MKEQRQGTHRLDGLAIAIGHVAAWLVLAMMLAQVALVLGRGLFGLGALRLHEAVIYANAVFIGAGVAYALARNGHTRIDVLRARMTPRGRALVDLLATLVLLLPTIAVLIWASTPYVSRAWQALEGSRSVGGLPGVFLFKTILLVLPALLLLPAVAIIARTWRDLAAKSQNVSPAPEHRP